MISTATAFSPLPAATLDFILPTTGFSPISPQGPVYFFLDFANIGINARQLAAEHGDGLLRGRDVRLSCENLRLFAQRNRPWGSGYAAAALCNQQAAIKRHFEQQGIRFEICEPGAISGKEQNVDRCIQLEMHRLITSGRPKGSVVLATGDGAGHHRGEGFLDALATAYRAGFAIEVMSWRHSFNEALRDWAITHGRVIELDDYYHDLTFVQGGRRATSKYQLSRKLARNGIVSL